MARQSKGITLPIIYKADLKGLKDAEGGLEKFGRVAGRIGAAAAAALGAVVVSGVKMATDLQTTFSQIEGLVGVTGDELDKLKDAAKELGPEFGKSAQEAADALFFITSAGLRGADAVEVLEASLKASAVGLGATSEIANAATAAVNTYGTSVLGGAEAVDALTEAVRLGQFAPEELAGALGRVVPISAELGVSFEETVGAVAALTRGGLNASEAVTGVRGAMQAVLKPTQEAERILQDYGLSADGVRDSIKKKGFLQTFIDLRDVFGDNEDAFLRLIGSQEGLNAVLSLTGENVQTNLDIINEMTDGIGILDEAFAKTEDTVGFKAAQAFETFKGIMLDIGDAVLPVVSDVLETLSPAIQDAADGIAEFIATDLGPWIDGLQSNDDFQNFLQTITDLFFEVVPDIASAAIEIATLATNLKTLLQPALDDLIGDDGLLSSFTSILDDVNFFLGEINKVEIPGFNDGLGDMLEPIERLLNPMQNLIASFRDLANWINEARRAYERWTGQEAEAPRQPAPPPGRTTPTPPRGSLDVINTEGPRAAGGSVMGGLSYLVGERGPEIFVPRMSGDIVPTHRLGGGSQINIVVNAGMGANGSDIGRQIVAQIRKYERTSGRVFAAA